MFGGASGYRSLDSTGLEARHRRIRGQRFSQKNRTFKSIEDLREAGASAFVALRCVRDDWLGRLMTNAALLDGERCPKRDS